MYPDESGDGDNSPIIEPGSPSFRFSEAADYAQLTVNYRGQVVAADSEGAGASKLLSKAYGVRDKYHMPAESPFPGAGKFGLKWNCGVMGVSTKDGGPLRPPPSLAQYLADLVYVDG